MIELFKQFFSVSGETPPETEVDSGDRLQVATCAVLLEVACSDDEFTEEERASIIQSLRDRFSLDEAEAKELIQVADESRANSVDLWQYTNRINQTCTNDEKIQIIEEVWRVICADHAIDGHEDHFVHRLAKLLNLTHRQLIDAKVKVLDEFRS